MMTSNFSRALDAGPLRGCASARSIQRVFRNHIRVVLVAFVMSLLLAVMFSVPGTGGAAAYLTPKPIPVGDPTNLAISATSDTTISLSWTAPAGGAAHYRVERSENISAPFMLIANVTGTTFNDTTITSLHAYLYRVLAVTADGCPSVPSNVALGTAISFEFSQLLGQQIRAQHIHRVRTAINAVRAVGNLAPANWARGTVTNLEIKAQDFLEMRTRLDEALEALEINIEPYQDPALNTGANGTPIKAIHIEQLQTRSTRGIRSNPNLLESISDDKSQVGQFESPITLPLVPVHLSVLPDGRILFWGRDMNVTNDLVKETSGKSQAYIWNIADGANKTDVAVFRPSENKWYVINQSGVVRETQWGITGDRPVPGDYDGDGRADLAIFRPSNGLWAIRNSSNGMGREEKNLGINGDVPVPGDYDQDGKTDVAVFRPSESKWYIRRSTMPNEPDLVKEFGESGDVPVPGDYDQDRKTDIAIFRPSTGFWHILKSSSSNGSVLIFAGGLVGNVVPAPGDYNGDGTTDLAVYNPSDGKWYIRNIINNFTQNFFVGQSPSAIVAPGDYDGDGKTDAAIFRSSEGNWQIRNSSGNGETHITSWGQNGDVPVPGDYDGMLRVANTTTNLFCSGHSFLPDGRLLVAGGHKYINGDGDGEAHINLFDFRSNSWVRGPEMNNGRWYPYNVTLSTGKTLIVSGSYFQQANDPATFKINTAPQIYNAGTGCLEDLSDAGDEFFSLYPFLHLTPDGKVLQIQSQAIVNVGGERIAVDDRRSRLFNPDAPTGPWPDFQSTRFQHASGSSILFDSGRKVLVVGGFSLENPSAATPGREAEYIDLQTPNATWTRVWPMKFKRAYNTATILPDGKVLVTGGVSCPGGNNIDCTDGAAMNAEMWDPTANPACLTQSPWRTMARQSEVRAYHSTAVLLPNGKVLIAGGGLPGAIGETDLNGNPIHNALESNTRLFGHKTVELYSPPYLFNASGNLAARPEITTAPASISYGETFFVGVSGALSLPKVSLVRLASVTHGFNQDQRHLFLSTPSSNASGINVTAPADAKICPPGYYMLFVLNNGVPSIAKIVRVGPASIFLTEAPETTADGQNSTWEQGVEFSSSVNGQITHVRFWKAPDETPGNHFGRIWTATGNPSVPLVEVPFTCETASGWQQAQLSTPLQITAGVRYKVTYNIHRSVAKTFNALDSPITRGPLTAWGSWFSTPAGSFPTSGSGSNLFADIVFKPGQ